MQTNSAVTDEIAYGDALRSVHHVINWLETSKRSSEDIIAKLPDAFFICSQHGNIVKGNHRAAELFDSDIEHILNTNILELFSEETAEVFLQALNESIRCEKSMVVEIPILVSEGVIRAFLWTISEFKEISCEGARFIEVIAKDIQEVLDLENHYSQIFSSMPIGLITCNRDGMIEHPYSTFAEVTLQQTSLEGRPLVEVLFEPCLDKLDSAETLGVGQINHVLGLNRFEFEMWSLHFPTQITLDIDIIGQTKERHLGLTYHPVCKDDRVDKMIILIQDQTDMVEMQKKSDLDQRVQSGKIKKILEIQNCAAFLLEATMQDFDNYLPQLRNETKNKDPKKIANVLHGLKGVARTAGFSHLVASTHDLESKILNDNSIDFDDVEAGVENIIQWCDEQKRLCFALSAKTDSIMIEHGSFEKATKMLHELQESLNPQQKEKMDVVLGELGIEKLNKVVSFNAVVDRVRDFERGLRGKTGKKFCLSVKIGKANIFREQLTVFSEIFLHLMTNAVDHGIESLENRQRSGKDEVATILLKATRRKGYTTFSLSDDGGGIDVSKVLKKACDLGVVTAEQSKGMRAKQIFNLLLLSEFSTKESVSETSGRGIGLDIVNEAVKSLGADSLKIESKKGEGTTFSFRVLSAE